MDPWLEEPSVWPDFHDALAGEIRAVLNQSLPEPYYAQLGVREEVGIIGERGTRRIVPDVSVQRPEKKRGDELSPVAVLAGPRTEVAESVEVDVLNEPQQVNFVEIRDVRSGHELVTLIEILSPSNKQPGDDQDSYLRKRDEVLSSRASLIEIDLLRCGGRRIYGPDVDQCVNRFHPPLDYLVLVQRAWRRGSRLSFQLFPSRVTQSLPVIVVPLRDGEREVPLDLQFAVQQAYDRGPYRRGAVNYDASPNPPLSGELHIWASEQIRGWRQ
jgi:hypothetical protein